MYVRVDEHNLSQSLVFIENTFKKFDAAATFDYSFLDKNFATQYHAEERQGEVLLAFTILTISIASLGLFGLITFTVGQRVKEIGIRKTLGASVTSLVSFTNRSLLKVVLMAMFVAIPLSWLAMNKWLQDFAYRITLQWWMFVLAGAIAGVIAIITVSFKAIKAAVANPVKSLRTE
jgi:putative ABC transport system permease protein